MGLARERLTRCDRVQLHLADLVGEGVPWWRRRWLERHLLDCEDCGDEVERQLLVAEGLGDMREVERSVAEVAPPEDLLDTILGQMQEPGLRARAAVPVRGAISGARPGLSVTFVVVLLAIIGVAGWAGWRLADQRRQA